MAAITRAVRVAAIAMAITVALAAVAVVGVETRWFKNWLRGYIVGQSSNYVNGEISIGRLGGNLFFGVKLEDVTVTTSGQDIATLESVALRYSVFEIVSKGVSIDEIALARPSLHVSRDEHGWSLSGLIKNEQSEADREGPGRPIHIGRIGISDGTVVIEAGDTVSGVRVPKRIDRLDAKLSFDYEPIHYTVNVDHVSFRSADPDVALNAFSGGISVRDDTVFLDKLAIRTAETSLAIDGAIQQYLVSPVARLSVSSDKISLPELARLFPALEGIELQPAFELKVDGPLEQLRANLNVRSAAGALLADAVLGYSGSKASAAGTVNVSKGDLARWLNRPDLDSELTGKLTFDVKSAVPMTLQSLTGTAMIATRRIRAVGYTADSIEANASFAGGRIAIDGNVAAYNARATARGTVWLPAQRAGTPAEDMSSAIRYDLRGRIQRLDLTKIPTPMNLRVETDLNGEYRARGGLRAVEADVRFAPSRVASTQIGADSRVEVTFDAGNIRYEADVRLAGLNPREAGRIFEVAALDLPRFEGSISTQAVVRGKGTHFDDLDVNGEATIFDSRLAGAYISQAWVSGTLAGATAQLSATGNVADLNPVNLGAASTADGTLAGSFDVHASLSGVDGGFDPDRLAANVRVDLEPSDIGPLRIDEGVVDARYAHNAADINQLTVKGEDVNVDVSGRLSLGHDQGSDLYFEADSTQLKTIGDALNVPLTGIGRISGTVSGDRERLNIAGSLVGNGVSYGSMQALTLNSDYQVDIPDLRPPDATLKTRSHATFVVVGGQHVNELDGTAEYERQEVTFDATAKQPDRTASASGSLRLLPDRQQVRLRHLALQTQGQEWQTVAQRVAEIEYGGDTITVRNLELSSGDQRIGVEGAFGSEGEGITTRLENIDLAGIDALLLRPPQFSGRLDATAHVKGTRDEPRITADFAVARGGFRKFQYDELRGSAEYQAAGVIVDARLQQNASASLTAKGSVPSALFRGDEGNGSAAAPMDLHIDSSGVDLGIVQGFTTALTDVRGGLEASVHVTGTADNPQANGAVTVVDGALTVGPTGAKYSAINGRLDLRGDRIEVNGVRVLDNDKDPATVSGTMSLRARDVSAIAVEVQTESFDVLDNEFGEVSLNSDLRLTGDLAHPRLEGNLGLGTGRLELDPILALVGNSAYGLNATEYQDSTEQTAADTAVPQGLFGALAIDVDFDVPDDLVVRGSDLKAPGSTFGLGAMNLTLGGNLHAQKDPGGAVKLTGTVNTVRGTYDFQDRRFEILRDGTLRFAGLEDLNPQLDIQARRVIQGVDANVSLEGTLQRPRVRLSSVPPLEDADILALIVFNQPLNQLGEGQQVTLTQRAAGLAEGVVAGQLAGAIGRALNLDTFEIQTADTGDAQVTAGQQIGQHAFVRLQQGIGDESQTNFVFEYQFLNWLRLESNFRVGTSIQPSLFNRVQDTGADLVIQLPRRPKQ